MWKLLVVQKLGWCPQRSAFRQSRQTINLLNNRLIVIGWGETISKITTLLYLDLCLFTIIYLWLWHGFTLWYTQRMQFNLSNLYPIDGPAFLLTQVCLVCPWVLYNGQFTDLVFCTFDTTIGCDSILFFLFLPLKVLTVGGINGSIWRSLIMVTHKGSAPSAYISLKYLSVWISEQ